MIRRLLIANRGEIACRVIRTAKKMGIHCIAVYSDADACAPHVKMADEAYYIGYSPARESYLDAEKILNIAKQAQAEAIHPGYGFLSENAEFAKDCEKAGILFVGPPAQAIIAMGSKSNAKQLMAQASVPLIPGYHGKNQTAADFIKVANEINFPVLLKASAGGGGKGMRVVDNAQEMETALAAAKRESLSSFGDDDMLLEKYLAKPRHVEIQIFSDKHGNHLYLFERDCSIQRRHQKIIEEAPAPGINDELRKAMGNAAIACAKAINYVGAGTIEFLLDEDGKFYFMEMNTRLQVEHPVTEMITGLDLVEWQLRIAAGEKLPLTQSELTLNGHAIEVRIYAEDPEHDFLPSIGKIEYLEQPLVTDFVRIDTGIETGSYISQYYDPLMAKLIVWGNSRSQAILRLVQALAHYRVCGVRTNLDLLTQIATHPDYEAANLFTHFITQHQTELFAAEKQPIEKFLIAAGIWQLKNNIKHSPEQTSPWFTGEAWRMNLPEEQHIVFELNNQIYSLRFIKQASHYQVYIGDQSFEVEVIAQNNQHSSLSINGIQEHYTIVAHDKHYTVFNGLHRLSFALAHAAYENNLVDTGSGHLRSPMPGTVTAILIQAGQTVKQGDALIIIEAMKMEHTIKAPTDGTIKSIHYQIGESVDEGAELIVVE